MFRRLHISADFARRVRRRSLGLAPWNVGAAACAATALAIHLGHAPSLEAAPASALVISTDYATGYYSGMALAPPFTATVDVASTCADAVARPAGNRIYLLGRYGCDFVQVVDATSLATLAQWSTGNGTNPQDIEVIDPGKAYVSLYDRNFILVLNPLDGSTLGTISLAAFADADGLPEAAEMALVGGRLFVALQRLDRPGGFVAANPSFLAVLDTATDQLVDCQPGVPGVQGIALTGRNPVFDLALDPVRQQLVVVEAGNYGVPDGGVEYVDPATLTASGFFATEAGLGGDLNGVRLWTDCTGYAIVNDASFRTRLLRFDRCTGAPLGTCWQSSGFDLCDLEIDFARGHVLVSDRDLLTPGIRVFAAGTCTQKTAAPVDFGLPPCDIAFAAPVPADAASALPRVTRLLPNWPDPFNPSTTLQVEAPPDERVRLDVLDVRGHVLQTLWEGPIAGGRRNLQWDGRDAAGRVLPSGVYFARLRVPGGDSGAVAVERMVLVR